MNVAETILFDLNLVQDKNGFVYMSNSTEHQAYPRFKLEHPELAEVIAPLLLTSHSKIKK